MIGPGAARSVAASDSTDRRYGASHITRSCRRARETSGYLPSVTRSQMGPVDRKDRSSAGTVLMSPCFRI